LKVLPRARLDATKQYRVKVSKRSTINIQNRIYSVDSRLRDEYVRVFVYANHLDVLYAQKKIDTLPRLHGKEKHNIQYRHIIDSLIRKPGAFENYRYKKDLFPTHRFRVAYDILKKQKRDGNKEYLKILHLAAKESEIKVDEALHTLLEQNADIGYENVLKLIDLSYLNQQPKVDTQVADIELAAYDTLLQYRRAEQ
jgi:hypothetical protein